MAFDLNAYDVLDDLNGIDRAQQFRRLFQALLDTRAELRLSRDGKPLTLSELDRHLALHGEIRLQVEEDADREAGESTCAAHPQKRMGGV